MTCFRDAPGSNDECPVADKTPELFESNRLPVDIFFEAQRSGAQVAAENKTYIYTRPSEVETLMRIRSIPDEERPDILKRVFILEELSNQLRPPHRKKA